LVASYQVMDTQQHIGASATIDTNYEGMKMTLKSISSMQAKGEIDADTINTVTTMLDKIENDLKDALVVDVSTTQNVLDDAEAAIAACDTAKRTFASDTWVGLNGDVTDESDEHDVCRGDEEIECGNATSKCTIYTNQVCGFEECVKPPASRFVTSDNDDVFEYMCCLERLFAAERGTYYQARWECLEAVNIWEMKTEDCDRQQTTFEDEFCSRETDVENACHTYRTCRNDKQASYTSIKSNVQSLEEIYQAQRVALECLLCYGNHILNNNTDLSSCEVLPECTSLTDCPQITYDPIPPCIACVEPDHDVPCTSNFINKFYSVYENTCTPPQDCSACADRSGFKQTEAALTCDPVAETAFDIAKR